MTAWGRGDFWATPWGRCGDAMGTPWGRRGAPGDGATFWMTVWGGG
ncbi:hypothetical protein HD595_003021 [Nonomuraea roseoviolacea subsp. carminata]|uniref:Uncharacterized protein n=1 Tax=Nonomuraea roseoviolacea subsp. carminata TaxID=160689 RepID=A0ABT1JZV5_9ACTN|nr:hypothetical protein [Nonomuraea roseoviolacea subsp. carminata]